LEQALAKEHVSVEVTYDILYDQEQHSNDGEGHIVLSFREKSHPMPM
jgi:hypothetical protein